MAQLELIKLPESVLERLRSLAQEHCRDVTSEAAVVLEQGLDQAEALEKELREIRALRAEMPNAWITDEMIRAARDEGRA